MQAVCLVTTTPIVTAGTVGGRTSHAYCTAGQQPASPWHRKARTHTWSTLLFTTSIGMANPTPELVPARAATPANEKWVPCSTVQEGS